MKQNIYKTHSCGELRISDVGKEVRLSGWVNSIRRLGGIVFLTLRDHFGITQILLKNEEIGVINAETLWRYYTGELTSEKEIKSIIGNFVNELLRYSQEQEEEITEMTEKLM